MILSFCDLASLARSALVSSRFNRAASTDFLWAHQFHCEYCNFKIPADYGSFRSLYRRLASEFTAAMSTLSDVCTHSEWRVRHDTNVEHALITLSNFADVGYYRFWDRLCADTCAILRQLISLPPHSSVLVSRAYLRFLSVLCLHDRRAVNVVSLKLSWIYEQFRYIGIADPMRLDLAVLLANIRSSRMRPFLSKQSHFDIRNGGLVGRWACYCFGDWRDTPGTRLNLEIAFLRRDTDPSMISIGITNLNEIYNSSYSDGEQLTMTPSSCSLDFFGGTEQIPLLSVFFECHHHKTCYQFRGHVDRHGISGSCTHGQFRMWPDTLVHEAQRQNQNQNQNQSSVGEDDPVHHHVRHTFDDSGDEWDSEQPYDSTVFSKTRNTATFLWMEDGSDSDWTGTSPVFNLC